MQKTIQIIILGFSVFVFFLGNLFNVVLSIPTFQKLSVGNSLSEFQAISLELREAVEGAEESGQSIENRIDVDKTARDLKRRNPAVDNIVVSLPDGRILLRLNDIGVERPGPPRREPDFSERGETAGAEPAAARPELMNGYYHALSPIRNAKNQMAGMVDVIVREETVLKRGHELIQWSLKRMAAFTLIASLFMVAALLIWVDYQVIRIPKRNICIILYLFLTCSQLLYSGYTVAVIESEKISDLVNKRVESSAVPAAESSDAGPRVDSGRGFQYARTVCAVIWKELNVMIADALTILVITFIFATELIIFLFILVDKFQKKHMKHVKISETDRRQSINSYSLIRPDAFIFCFAIDLSVSFLPLYSKELYTPIWGLSRDFVIGLPISSTMICACIAFITAGTWIDKYGWRKCHFRGVLFAGVGLFLSGIARTSTGFILYQGVIGFGYGLAFISYMAFVYAATNRRQQTIGFSVMSAGMFSGSICGGAVGGMLAERIEYSSVFFVGTALVGLALVFPSLFMRVNVRKKSKPPEKSTPRISATLLLRFCLNRNIFSLLLMLSIPSAVVFVGFLYYFSPVYLDRLGVSEADIARILMINGIGLIYLAPLISPIIDRSRSKKKFIVLSGLLSAFAIMIFSLIEGVVAVVISIAIISLAAAFGNSTRTVYALQQKAALDLGSGLSMSIYRAVDRIGWVLGPMVIGFILALGNIRLGLTIMGVVCLGFTLLFLIVSKEETR